MAMLTSTTTELAHQYQTAYDKELMKQKDDRLVLDQFAFKKAFPKDAGAKTIRYFRYAKGTSAAVTALTEGVALTTYSELDLDYVEATIAQYGTLVKLSDVLTLTNLFNSMKASMNFISQAMAFHADDVMRNAIVAGVTSTATGNKRYAQQLANFAALVAATNSAGSLTVTDLLDAMTVLSIQGAPKKNGRYYAIAPPQVTRDIMNDTKFLNVGYYQDKTNLVKGEAGEWYGIKIVTADNPFRETSTEGTYAAAGTIYTTIVTGTDGFGVPSMGGYSPFNPKTYIVNTPDSGNPLNQYAMLGAKSHWATAILNALWLVTIRSKSSHA